MPKESMIWPIIVTAKTHLPSGKARVMRRRVEGCGDIDAAALRALHSRKDRGSPFMGEEVRVLTPLGQRVSFLYEHDGKLRRWSVSVVG